MQNLARGAGRSGLSTIILAGAVAVPAAALEIHVAPPPTVHVATPLPQLHAVTPPTLKGTPPKMNGLKGNPSPTTGGSPTTTIGKTTTVGVAKTTNVGGDQAMTGAGAGKVTFNPFSITRKIDTASPSFLAAAASSAPFSFNKIDPTGKASVVSLINTKNAGLQQLQDASQSVSDLSDQQQLTLQNAMQQKDQFEQIFSEMLKDYQSTSGTIIGNLK